MPPKGADEGAMKKQPFSGRGARRPGAPFRREFRRLRAASYFAHGGKGTKTPPGTAQDGHFVSIFAFPRTPFTGVIPLGGQCPSGAQNLSGFPQFPPGHWALGLQKLPLVRFRFRAWLCRADDGWCRAVGRGLLDAPHISVGRPVSGPYEKEGRSPDSP